jgi:hypothetical protein
MTKLRSASELASLALERVGVFPAADSGPDPAQLSRALDRLDLNVGELAGTMRCLWLMRRLAVVPITPNVGDFDLLTQAGGAITQDDVQFVTDVKLRYSTTADDTPIRRVDQRGWDDVQAKTATGVNFSGPPSVVFIDRIPRLPHVYISPVPATTGFSLVLALQGYAPDLTLKDGNVQLGMEAAWHRWAEYQTAADIGSGPVVQLAANRIADYRGIAEKAKNKLVAFNAKSGKYPVRTKFRDV